MVNHVLQLSLQAFLYACGSARDKGVCVLCLSTEMLEARLYSLPIVHVHTRTFLLNIYFEPDYDLLFKAGSRNF